MERPSLSGRYVIAGLKALLLGRSGSEESPVVRRWAVALALVVEIGLFLWLPLATSLPWPVPSAIAGLVGVVLAVEWAWRGGRRRPRHLAFALGVALTVNVALASFMGLLLFLVLAQRAVAALDVVMFLGVPIVLAFALFMRVRLHILMALTVFLLIGVGLMLDAGPMVVFVVPFTLSMAVTSALFNTVSPGPGGPRGGLAIGVERHRDRAR